MVEDEIIELSKLLLSNSEISAITGISEEELIASYSDVILKAKAETYRDLRAVMLTKALDGNSNLLMFIAKNFLNMTDTKTVIETKVEEVLNITDIEAKINSLLDFGE